MQVNTELNEEMASKLRALLEKYRQEGLELKAPDIVRLSLNRLFKDEISTPHIVANLRAGMISLAEARRLAREHSPPSRKKLGAGGERHPGV